MPATLCYGWPAMRIVFLGSGELACPALEAVAKLPGHELVAVITQPDRPKGRQLKPAAPPVKHAAQRLRLPVHQPVKIRDDSAIQLLREVRPDLLIVVAYGQILPKAILDIPALGCVNVHASLLPRWRGAAPVQYAILHGDRETGVTTMFINEQMDAGDIILQRPVPIRSDDTSAALQARLARLGAELLVETVGLIASGRAPRTKQDESRATYAKKLTKEAGHINWKQPAEQIERQIRAFDPWPGAYTFLGETMLKLCRAEVVANVAGKPGEVLADLVVAAGTGGLKILELQPAGRKPMSADAFLRGHRLEPGTVLS
jgi:methionyl-tRNA formyltransferase